MSPNGHGHAPLEPDVIPADVTEIVTDAVIREHMGRASVTETLALVALKARQEADIARERVSLTHRAYRTAMARVGYDERCANYVAGLAVAILEEPKMLDILNLADTATWDALADLGDGQGHPPADCRPRATAHKAGNDGLEDLDTSESTP